MIDVKDTRREEYIIYDWLMTQCKAVQDNCMLIGDEMWRNANSNNIYLVDTQMFIKAVQVVEFVKGFGCDVKLMITARDDEEYPHKCDFTLDGVEVYTILTDKELEELKAIKEVN